MAYRNQPSEEELERLNEGGSGCKKCESRGSHGGRPVCRRQVAGRYNRQVFYDRSDPHSRPQWCPKKGRNAVRKGYASSESLPEPTGTGKKSPGPQHQTAPPSPMPQNPIRTIHKRKATSKPAVQNIPIEKEDPPFAEDPLGVASPPKEKKFKLKRKAKDAPWGRTDD